VRKGKGRHGDIDVDVADAATWAKKGRNVDVADAARDVADAATWATCLTGIGHGGNGGGCASPVPQYEYNNVVYVVDLTKLNIV
jgi:hypothetical protein